jgi:hypothetical protein
VGLPWTAWVSYSLKALVHYYYCWGGSVRRAAKKIEMLKRLYQVVVEGRSEFAWRDFFVLLAPVASHAYIQNTLYSLMGRGVLVKQDHKYIVVADKLEELLREHNAI